MNVVVYVRAGDERRLCEAGHAPALWVRAAVGYMTEVLGL